VRQPPGFSLRQKEKEKSRGKLKAWKRKEKKKCFISLSCSATEKREWRRTSVERKYLTFTLSEEKRGIRRLETERRREKENFTIDILI